ncbi:MAG: hypothetical protein FJZ78_10690 [Bacteroidetes bacterium]|nr:hypothetical protein [Bacteroidota bacterium]
MNSNHQERQSERAAALISIGIHGLILLVLFLLIAWKPADPPLPEYGMELSLGFTDQGSGEQVAQQEPQPVQPEPEPEPATPPVEAAKPQAKITPLEDEGPVVVKEEPKKKPEPKKETVKQPVTEETVKPKEPPKEKPKAVYEPAKPTEKTGEQASNSKGDDANATGEKGRPEGKVDARALYGSPGEGGGGGGGTGLELAGWRWDREPRPRLPETEKNGKIVFEIEVDEEGQITKLVTIERGVSPAAEKICREEILSLNFVQIGNRAPERSKGRVTIVVKSH